jgi:hypothetical protein
VAGLATFQGASKLLVGTPVLVVVAAALVWLVIGFATGYLAWKLLQRTIFRPGLDRIVAPLLGTLVVFAVYALVVPNPI